MKIKFTLTLVLSICTTLLINAQIDYKPFAEWAWGKQGSSEYYLYTPKNIPVGHKCPIVIFLHGCCGTSSAATPRNCVDPGARVWHNFGENTQTEPMYILSANTTSGWSQHFTNLKAAVDALVTANKVDAQRIYINGFSMGGSGTWQFINAYPTYFAAAAPMGCVPSGNYNNLYKLPIFQNTSNGDIAFANPISEESEIGSIRQLNGYTKGGEQWETGVNARWHMYNGGHGTEQWMSTQEQGFIKAGKYIWYSHEHDIYPEWMLSKVNDGNAYPSVFFETPDFIQMVTKGSTIPVKIKATDDGSITKVEFYANKILKATITTLTAGFYQTTVKINNCETLLEAKAFDNLGKTSTSSILVRTNQGPIITTTELPDGKVGSMYYKQLFAIGNQGITFKVAPNSSPLPNGLRMTDDGVIKGMPTVAGTYTLRFTATDNLNDSVTKGGYTITILPKNTDEVLVTNMKTKNNAILSTFKIKKGELPWSDITLTTYTQTATYLSTEGNFSGTSVFDGLTYIQTPSKDIDVNDNTTDYLSFTVDVPVTIYIAYEYKNNLATSTKPSWLTTDFTKETSNEMVVQYFYYEVYSKNYPAGTITLPGANANANNVSTNYFVMVKKQGITLNLTPEITSSKMPDGFVGYRYKEKLTNLDGMGKTTWSLESGALPDGLSLAADGTISGGASKAGTYTFTAKITDGNANTTTKILTIKILSDNPKQLFVKLNDTIIIKNSGAHQIVMNNVTNGSGTAQNCTVNVNSANTGLLTVDSPVKKNDSTYTFNLTPVTDQIGSSSVKFNIKDNTNTDTANNTFAAGFNVKVIPFINLAPHCGAIADFTTGMNYSSVKQTISFSGVNDGNDGSQIILASATSTNTTICRSLKPTYTSGTTGTITFYPNAIGTTTITLKLKDNGGTDLNGKDSVQVSFKITVLATYSDVPENKYNDIQIYPNPASDVIYLELPEELKSNSNITIYDILGSKIAEYSNLKEINTQNILSGNYLIVISNKEGFLYKSMIRIQK